MIIDKKIDKVLKDLCPRNYPIDELNYLYIKENEVVVTDAKRLIVIESQEQFVSQPTFVNIKNNKKLKSNILIFDYPAIVSDNLQYPNYKRIIERNFDKEITLTKAFSLSEVIINIGSITKEQIYISYFDALKSMNEIGLKDTKIYWNNENSHFMIEGDYYNYIVKLIILPILV